MPNRRTMLITGLAATGALAAPAQAATPMTFVLVHGAWHGGWSWKKVAPGLRAAGHQVFTPTLTGVGERAHLGRPEIDLDAHVRDITALLEFEDLRDVVLVGHSYAGMVITGVAAAAPERLGQLVYLDAFLPEPGKCLNDYVPGFVAQYEKGVRERGEGWRLPFNDALSLRALGVTDPTDVAWMTPRMTDQPYRTFTQGVRPQPAAAQALRRTYLLSSERPHYLAAAERARQQGFRVLHVPGAGHDVMVTQPRDLIAALLGLG